MSYLICLEGGGGKCATYYEQGIAESEAKRISLKAGAHFIAVETAVNAHAALVAALRGLLECYAPNSTRLNEAQARVVTDANVALDKAEGGAP